MAEKLKQQESLSAFSAIPLVYIDRINDTEITVLHNGIEKQIPLSLDNKTNFPNSNPEDLATIIYTSGTSGSSKGVMLSSKNIISCAYSCFKFYKIRRQDRFLSILPLAHSYECSVGFLAPFISGASITYIDKPPSPSVLLPAVKIIRPTVIISVPLLIEKIFNNAIAPKLRKNKLYKFHFTRPLAIRAAGRKLLSALGGRIRFFGIGGAPLNPETEDFLNRARFPYAIGYGLTEASPLIAGNSPYRSSVRVAGTACEGVSIRIAECAASVHAGIGEVQVKGPNIMLGYYEDPERTAEAFTSDGWLRTGDLGCLDKKGRLYIRGRLKAVILGPSGENIYPEEIEGLLGSSQLVEDALVYSGKKGELVALVRLTDVAKSAAVAIESTLEDLRSWVNKKLADFSRLNRIEIRYEPFEKTPTMKIKRYLYV
jgi:long-chain acyl-CoA synthetase